MAKITQDAHWSEPSSCKSLILEHRMAATRMGFLDVFGPLYDVDSWRTSFLEGTLPASRFFARDVLPLVKAQLAADRFGVARVLKALSPLLSPESLRQASIVTMLRIYAAWAEGAVEADIEAIKRSMNLSQIRREPLDNLAVDLSVAKGDHCRSAFASC